MNSEQINEIATALAKAQGGMSNAKINKEAVIGPQRKYRYADLPAIIDAVKASLSANGIGYTQTIQFDDAGMTLVTMLMHVSGQWIKSEYPLPINAKPQDFGSALTYARRYSLSAIVGISADEDDDAAAANKANGAAIDTLQLRDLANRIAEVGLPIHEFLDTYKIEAPGDLPAAKYEDAMKRLLNYQRKKAAKVDDDASTQS